MFTFPLTLYSDTEGASPPYEVPAVTFDGSADYLTRGADYTSNVDSKQFIFSAWVKRSVNDTTQYIIYGITSLAGYYVRFEAGGSANQIKVYAGDSAGNQALNMNSSVAITDTDWHHVIAAGDIGVSNDPKIYIDDVDVTNIIIQDTTRTPDYTRGNHAVGGTTAGANLLSADLAELWFETGNTLDISVQSNRRKFVTGDIKPVDLGAAGDTPTGSSPMLFLGTDEPNWHVNAGDGGGLTENGALTTASTNPGQ